MMLKTTVRPLIALLTAAAAVGCAKGPLPGRLTQPGKPPETVTLNYESSVLGGGGKLWTLLPDGERYSGKYILTPYAAEHHMTSDLVGDRGGTMVCRFRLNEPGVGPDGGGAGQCQISEGGVIDMKF
jgi:hypothetical protein